MQCRKRDPKAFSRQVNTKLSGVHRSTERGTVAFKGISLCIDKCNGVLHFLVAPI